MLLCSYVLENYLKKKKAFKTTKEGTSLKKERSLTILYSSEVTLLLNQCGQIMSSL